MPTATLSSFLSLSFFAFHLEIISVLEKVAKRVQRFPCITFTQLPKILTFYISMTQLSKIRNYIDMIHYRLYLNLISFPINAIFWPRSHPGFHVALSMSFMMLTLQESSSQWSGFMWCFLVIKLRLCTFSKSATQVMLCLPQVPGGVCVLSRSVCV